MSSTRDTKRPKKLRRHPWKTNSQVNTQNYVVHVKQRHQLSSEQPSVVQIASNLAPNRSVRNGIRKDGEPLESTIGIIRSVSSSMLLLTYLRSLKNSHQLSGFWPVLPASIAWRCRHDNLFWDGDQPDMSVDDANLESSWRVLIKLRSCSAWCPISTIFQIIKM